MADGWSVEVDSAAVTAALLRLGDTAQKYTKPACKVSADSMKAEMQSRIARRTGATAAGILVSEVGDDYVVHTIDFNPFTSRYYQMHHVGLYLERGTSLGARGSHASAARPWFWPSVALEASSHERRIQEAVADGIAEEGLGS